MQSANAIFILLYTKTRMSFVSVNSNIHASMCVVRGRRLRSLSTVVSAGCRPGVCVEWRGTCVERGRPRSTRKHTSRWVPSNEKRVDRLASRNIMQGCTICVPELRHVCDSSDSQVSESAPGVVRSMEETRRMTQEDRHNSEKPTQLSWSEWFEAQPQV